METVLGKTNVYSRVPYTQDINTQDSTRTYLLTWCKATVQ